MCQRLASHQVLLLRTCPKILNVRFALSARISSHLLSKAPNLETKRIPGFRAWDSLCLVQEFGDAFEPKAVGIVEGVELVAVDVKHGGDVAFSIVNGYDNLAA